MSSTPKTSKAAAKSGHCEGCNATKTFSKTQWRKHANERRCSECVQAPKKAGLPRRNNDAKAKAIVHTSRCHGCDSTKNFKHYSERRCVECLQRRSTSRACRGCKVERRGTLLDNTDLCLVCLAWPWPWTPAEEHKWGTRMAVVTDEDRLYRGAVLDLCDERFAAFGEELMDPILRSRMAKRSARGMGSKELEEELLRSTLTRMCDGCRRPLAYDDIKLCGGCRTAEYHGPECQRRHWKEGHKEECKELKEAPDLVQRAKRDIFSERERWIEDLGLTVDSLLSEREEYLEKNAAGVFVSDMWPNWV